MGKDLKSLRVDAGWTQYQLAEKSGVSRHVVSRAEKGDAIKPASAKAMADALSMALGYEVKASEIEGLNVE
jgi:transcriptional regulator with XRE-family HTH domain